MLHYISAVARFPRVAISPTVRISRNGPSFRRNSTRFLTTDRRGGSHPPVSLSCYLTGRRGRRPLQHVRKYHNRLCRISGIRFLTADRRGRRPRRPGKFARSQFRSVGQTACVILRSEATKDLSAGRRGRRPLRVEWNRRGRWYAIDDACVVARITYVTKWIHLPVPLSCFLTGRRGRRPLQRRADDIRPYGQFAHIRAFPLMGKVSRRRSDG